MGDLFSWTGFQYMVEKSNEKRILIFQTYKSYLEKEYNDDSSLTFKG